MKSFLPLLLVSTAAGAWANTASAQSSPTANPTPQADQQDQAGLAEIVVTAQRRAENVQKSSLAISVISAEDLTRQGIRSTQDLTRTLPGLQIGIAGPTPQIYVRGVGDPGTTAITNPAVALNVGGVYSARSGAAGGAFYDVDRVEVLKGPQGTLYGRNASGGAINILPTRPRLDATEALINLEAGNYVSLTSDGAVNLPIGSTAAIRASYRLQHRDGYLSDGSDDTISQAARLQMLFEPNDRFSLLLYGSYFNQGGVGAGFALHDPAGNPAVTPARPATPEFDPWTSATDARGAAILATRAPPPIFRPGNPNELYQNNRFWNFQAELRNDLGFATLTTISSYQRSRLDYSIYPALWFQTRSGAGSGSPETSRSYSGEVRLSNDGTDLKWVVGAFYYDERQNSESTINNGLAQNTSLSTLLRTKSAAIFGQATYSLLDTLRIIGGVRYTNDKRTLDGTRTNNLLPPAVNTGAISGQVEANKVNYKAGVEFDVSPRNMLYATVATGFKGGGISQAITAPFKPEEIVAYTVGSRNRFFDNRLQINVEGFYWKYENQHVQVITPDDVGVIGALIRNAGTATSYGVEADVQFKLTRNGTLSLGGAYNDAKYDSFVYQTPVAFVTPGRTGCPVTLTGATGPAGPVASVDCSGRPLQRAPKWSGNVAYDHRFDLGTNGSLTLNGNMQFASSREASIDYIPNTHAPSYQIFNASLTYAAEGGNLSVTGFVRNIGNEAVYLGGYQSTFTATYVGMTIGPPRTYGARLSFRY